jgi:hypothetical protein
VGNTQRVVSAAAVRVSSNKTSAEVQEDVIVSQAGPQQQTVPRLLGEAVSTGLSPKCGVSMVTEIIFADQRIRCHSRGPTVPGRKPREPYA